MPRDTLTVEQIVRASIELLDTEGLAGLNMRALGTRLGSAATAVYWHVGSKDRLIALAGDQVWGEIELPPIDPDGWRSAAERMATGLYAMLTAHPWLVQAFGSYMIFGPGKARYDDHNLAIYEAAGFKGTEADQAAAAVFTFVLGNALGPAAADGLHRKLSREGVDVEEHMKESMAAAVAVASEFPRLRARLDTVSTEYAAAPDNTFQFGLRAILDGLHAEVR